MPFIEKEGRVRHGRPQSLSGSDVRASLRPVLSVTKPEETGDAIVREWHGCLSIGSGRVGLKLTSLRDATPTPANRGLLPLITRISQYHLAVRI